MDYGSKDNRLKYNPIIIFSCLVCGGILLFLGPVFKGLRRRRVLKLGLFICQIPLLFELVPEKAKKCRIG
jgi:hypothetical protein